MRQMMSCVNTTICNINVRILLTDYLINYKSIFVKYTDKLSFELFVYVIILMDHYAPKHCCTQNLLT